MLDQTNGQLGLTLFTGLENSTIFSIVEKSNPSNGSKATALAMAKRSDIAKALNLKGKDNADKLSAAILEETDKALKQMEEYLHAARNNPKWTAAGMRHLASKNGETVTLRIKSVDPKLRRKGPTPEQFVEYMNKLGHKIEGRPWTVADVLAMESRQAALEAKVTDVDSTVTAGQSPAAAAK